MRLRARLLSCIGAIVEPKQMKAGIDFAIADKTFGSESDDLLSNKAV